MEFIGKGKFGEVYKGISNSQNLVAIKIERNNMKLLKHETTILHYLYRKGCKNIPIVHWFGVGGTVSSPTPILVMTYFEKGLRHETLPNKVGSLFHRMISILENIHQLGVIHRDIKTSNFMFDANGDIHLIDFGFATFYQDKPNNIKEYILGTPSFISIHIHNGNEPSRRDDLISLGYIYLYFTDDENPLLIDYSSLFCDLPTTDSNINVKHPSILEKREGKKWENLSKYLNPTSGIYKYLEYCYLLKYEDKPDYTKLTELLCGTTTGATS